MASIAKEDAFRVAVVLQIANTVITGSFNITKAAEESSAFSPASRNACAHLLVIRDADLAAKYAKNWQEHLGHSVPYEGTAAQS